MLLIPQGLSRFSVEELEMHGARNITAQEDSVRFCASPETILRLAYTGHSFQHILGILSESSTIEELFVNLPEGIGSVSITVFGTDRVLQEQIRDSYKAQLLSVRPELRVVYTAADVALAILRQDRSFILCINLFEIDFAKRRYKVFMHPTSLKGWIAYAALKLAGYQNGKTIMDPFCGSGMIPIEAALVARNLPLFYYEKEKLLAHTAFNHDYALAELEEIDKNITQLSGVIYAFDSMMGSVRIAQKNAKIAGVGDDITVRRVEVDWVDIKLKEKVDCIVTEPPHLSRNFQEGRFRNLYSQLFERGGAVLKKNGNLVIITKNPDTIRAIAADYHFERKEVITLGQLSFVLLRQNP